MVSLIGSPQDDSNKITIFENLKKFAVLKRGKQSEHQQVLVPVIRTVTLLKTSNFSSSTMTFFYNTNSEKNYFTIEFAIN